MGKRDLQYGVLGLGIFGSSVAQTLSEYRCEVLAMDHDKECVQRLADIVTTCVQGDITDINVLRSAGFGECDVCIVGLGSHLEESILCILNLKELGVPYIVAKAKNKSYKEILLKIGADKVVRPERMMGIITAKSLLNRAIVDVVDIDDEFSIVEIKLPNSWIGKTLRELDVRNKHNINILGVRHANKKFDSTPSPDYKFVEDDQVLFLANSNTLSNLNF